MGMVKVQEVGGSTYTLSIPKNLRKDLRIRKGQMMFVKVNGKARIIYEPVPSE